MEQVVLMYVLPGLLLQRLADAGSQADRQGRGRGLVAKHIRREGLVGSSNGWIEVFKVTIFVLRPILDGAAVKRG